MGNVIQKFRSKGNTMKQAEIPLTILTQNDLNEYSQKYITENTISMLESNEGFHSKNDNSLIIFGSVNKTNDTPSNQTIGSKFSNSTNKFGYYNSQFKSHEKKKKLIKSLKENLVSTQNDIEPKSRIEQPQTSYTNSSNISHIKSMKNLHYLSPATELRENFKWMDNFLNKEVSDWSEIYRRDLNSVQKEVNNVVYHSAKANIINWL